MYSGHIEYDLMGDSARDSRDSDKIVLDASSGQGNEDNQSGFLKHNRGLQAEIERGPGRNLDDYEYQDNLMDSQTFLDHFFNATHTNTYWEQEDVLIALTSDKPVYKTGDVAYFRMYYFNMTTKEPVECSSYYPSWQIIDAQDTVISEYQNSWGRLCEGISYNFEYEVPDDQVGGVYFARVYHWDGSEAVLKVRIRDYQSTGLVKVDYSRGSYAPGDLVSGKLTYESVDSDTIPNDAYFEIDTSAGHSLTNNELDSYGSGFFEFQIPTDFEENAVFVSYTVHVGAEVSTRADTITIVQGDSVAIDFTGESGKIVYNVLNKVYMECWADENRNEHADISNAYLLEKYDGETAGSFIKSRISTMYHGRGTFDFVPRRNHEYFIVYKDVEHALDIESYNKRFSIEATDSEAMVLIKTRQSVFENDDQFEIILTKSYPDEEIDYMLTINQRKHVLHSEVVTLQNVDTRLTIDLSTMRLLNGGVVSINLYDVRKTRECDGDDYYLGCPWYSASQDFPYETIASKLAFIKPSKTLDIQLSTDRDVYSPGQTVTYSVTVTDKATGAPVEEDVYVSMAVTDLSAFLQVDNKRQPASLVSRVFLEKETMYTTDYEFLNANEYINALYQILENEGDDMEEADAKIELLLGTQTWRLFMEDPLFREYYAYKQYFNSDKLSERVETLRLADLWGSQAFYFIMFGDVMEPILDDDMVVVVDVPTEDYDIEAGSPPAPEVPTDRANDSGSSIVIGEEEEPEDVVRVDFRETQLFTEFIQITNGQYSSSFELGDLITKFQFSVDAVSSAGVYGALTQEFVSNKDFYIDATMPQFLTNSDVIEVPLLVRNNKNSSLTVDLTSAMSITAGELDIFMSETQITVDPLSTESVTLTLTANQPTKDYFSVTIGADCGTNCSDSFTVNTRIIGRGFPVKQSTGGYIGMNDDQFVTETSLNVSLSETYEAGTFDVTAKVYTTQLSHLNDALSGLLREPYGCFEQTSSTTYPMVMALQVMLAMPEKTSEVHEMIMEGTKYLQNGYNKLLTFETPEGGFEWFGAAPGHETLTAYGLMQFDEMKEVLSDVDQQMIDRTVLWLMRRRDGRGAFRMADNGLDSFARPPSDIATAYIIYALTEIGHTDGLDAEIDYLRDLISSNSDTYLNALVANILYNMGQTSEAREISSMLAGHQDGMGEVSGSETSVTRSSGESLAIETTALCALAWLKDPSSQFGSNIELAVKYMVSSVEDSYYKSTQATALSLKVLVEFLTNVRLDGTGAFELTIDGISIQTYDFDSGTSISTIDFTDDLATYLSNNQDLFSANSTHTVTLSLNDFEGDEEGFRIAYAMQVNYKDVSPYSVLGSDLTLTVTTNTTVTTPSVGDIFSYNVEIQNTDPSNGHGMLTAIIRAPSCQKIDFNWLESIHRSGEIAYFEVLNDNTDVVLYWRSMDPNETKTVDVQMSLMYEYTTCIFRPHKAYLYYNEGGSAVWTT